MGKKDDPKPPPLPPDYTNQRQGAVAAENSKRQNTASAYNSAINHFNKQLTGYGSSISGLETELNDFDISSDWSKFDTYKTRINDTRGQLQNFLNGNFSAFQPYTPPQPSQPSYDFSNINLDNLFTQDFDVPANSQVPGQTYTRADLRPENMPFSGGYTPSQSSGTQLQYDQFGMPVAPNWSPTGTQYGESVFYEMPTLASLNKDQANTYLRQLDALDQRLNQVSSEREREQSRASDFFSGIIDQANDYDVDVKYADLNSNFERYNADLERARNRISTFQSPLDFSDQRQAAMAELAELESLLSGRRAEQEGERGRINQTRQSVANELNSLQEELRTMGIADFESRAPYEARINELRGQLDSFDSDLNFDFSNEYGITNELMSRLSSLSSERSAEERRLAQLEAELGMQAGTLARRAERATIYDPFSTQSLEDEIAALRARATNVNSPLSYDFTEALESLLPVEQRLANLANERNAALQGERTDVENIIAGLEGVEAYDEGGMRDIRDRLMDELADLQRYGSGTEDNMSFLEDALGSVDDRIRELGASRRGIESEALGLLQNVRDGEYTNFDELGALEEAFKALRSRSETWGALSANDELASIEEILRSQNQRLTNDRANVEAADNREAAEVRAMMDGQGNIRFARAAGELINNEEALIAYLQRNGLDEEDIFNVEDTSAFARNMMGAYA